MNQLLSTFGEQHLVGFMLTLARIGPLFLVAPLFSSKMVPRKARSIAAVGLAVGLSPLAVGDTQVPTDAMSLAGLVMKEALIGLAFAYTIAALFAAMSAAGSLLDTQIGFSFGSLLDPVTNQQSGILSQIYGLVGVGVFVAIGGDSWVIRGLAGTYDMVGVTEMPNINLITGGVQHAFASILLSAIAVSAPVLIAVIITDAGFGVVSRVMPQLNVFAVGFPAKILIGFVLIGTSLPFVAHWIGDQLTQSVGDALKSIRVA